MCALGSYLNLAVVYLCIRIWTYTKQNLSLPLYAMARHLYWFFLCSHCIVLDLGFSPPFGRYTHSHGNIAAAVGHSNVCTQVSVKILWEFIQQQQRYNHINMPWQTFTFENRCEQYDTLGIFFSSSPMLVCVCWHICISHIAVSIVCFCAYIEGRKWKQTRERKKLGNINSNQLFHFNTQNGENTAKDDKKNEWINKCRMVSKIGDTGHTYSKILDCLHTAICVYKQQQQQ